MPDLIFTGPSPRGWHRLSLVLRCPSLYAYVYVLGLKLPPSRPLIRGSLRHVGLAHHYARMRARQRGENENQFYAPREAMQRAAAELDREFATSVASELVLTHADMPDFYAQAFPDEEKNWEILAVEQVAETKIAGFRYTARFDLVVKDHHGGVHVIDHKGSWRIDARSVLSYTLNGQILGLRWLGSAIYGAKFRGVRIGFVSGEKPPFKFERKTPDPAVHAYSQFPSIVSYAEERISWVHTQPDPWALPKVVSDVVCVARYGRCPAYSLCENGKGGIADLAMETALLDAEIYEEGAPDAASAVGAKTVRSQAGKGSTPIA